MVSQENNARKTVQIVLKSRRRCVFILFQSLFVPLQRSVCVSGTPYLSAQLTLQLYTMVNPRSVVVVLALFSLVAVVCAYADPAAATQPKDHETRPNIKLSSRYDAIYGTENARNPRPSQPEVPPRSRYDSVYPGKEHVASSGPNKSDQKQGAWVSVHGEFSLLFPVTHFFQQRFSCDFIGSLSPLVLFSSNLIVFFSFSQLTRYFPFRSRSLQEKEKEKEKREVEDTTRREEERTRVVRGDLPPKEETREFFLLVVLGSIHIAFLAIFLVKARKPNGLPPNHPVSVATDRVVGAAAAPPKTGENFHAKRKAPIVPVAPKLEDLSSDSETELGLDDDEEGASASGSASESSGSSENDKRDAPSSNSSNAASTAASSDPERDLSTTVTSVAVVPSQGNEMEEISSVVARADGTRDLQAPGWSANGSPPTLIVLAPELSNSLQEIAHEQRRTSRILIRQGKKEAIHRAKKEERKRAEELAKKAAEELEERHRAFQFVMKWSPSFLLIAWVAAIYFQGRIWSTLVGILASTASNLEGWLASQLSFTSGWFFGRLIGPLFSYTALGFVILLAILSAWFTSSPILVAVPLAIPFAQEMFFTFRTFSLLSWFCSLLFLLPRHYSAPHLCLRFRWCRRAPLCTFPAVRSATKAAQMAVRASPTSKSGTTPSCRLPRLHFGSESGKGESSFAWWESPFCHYRFAGRHVATKSCGFESHDCW